MAFLLFWGLFLGGWYRKFAALTATERNGSQGLFYGLFLGGWYRKFAALTATKKWGAGATLLSAMGRKGCSGGMVAQVRCAHRNRTQWVARAVLGGWYRKFAALTATERNGSQGLF